MILGIGRDIADIRRIENLLEKPNSRFIQKYFTDIEIDRAEKVRSINGHSAIYAKRFAAKEALSKALGTGISQGVFMKDIGVENIDTGQPILKLTGGAQKKLEDITPKGFQAVIHLTLTDEPPLAEAMVIIEALPDTVSNIV